VTIAKLEWDDVNFINSLKTKEATGIQIREIEGEKKVVLTFDVAEVKAKRVEDLAQTIAAMRKCIEADKEAIHIEFHGGPYDIAYSSKPTFFDHLRGWLHI
jgi:hypothetical protein